MKTSYAVQIALVLVLVLAMHAQGADQNPDWMKGEKLEPILRTILSEHGFLSPPVMVDATNAVVFLSERVKGPGTLDRIVGSVNRDGIPGAWITRFQLAGSDWAMVGKLLYDAKPESEAIEKQIGEKFRVNPATGLRGLDLSPMLLTATFKVDPKTFAAKYEKLMDHKKSNPPTPVPPSTGGIRTGSESDNPAAVDSIVKLIRQETGVDLSSSGRQLFYNDRLGMLMFRATDEELSRIEKFIRMLNRNLVIPPSD